MDISLSGASGSLESVKIRKSKRPLVNTQTQLMVKHTTINVDEQQRKDFIMERCEETEQVFLFFGGNSIDKRLTPIKIIESFGNALLGTYPSVSVIQISKGHVTLENAAEPLFNVLVWGKYFLPDFFGSTQWTDWRRWNKREPKIEDSVGYGLDLHISGIWTKCGVLIGLFLIQVYVS